MTSLRKQLDSLHVRVVTPDGSITTELRGRFHLRLAFAPGWYDRRTDEEIADKLTTLARLLWVARTREFWRILSADSGEHLTGEERAIGARAVMYREERAALVAEGRSANSQVAIKAKGMRSWAIDVLPGTVRTHDEHAFAAMVVQAGTELIQEQYRKIAQLKARVYG